jgi:hypothetical protein
LLVETYDYYGTKLPKLKDDEVALGAVVMIKLMTAEGNVVYREYKAPEIHPVEALGMVTTMQDSIKAVCMAGANRQQRP